MTDPQTPATEAGRRLVDQAAETRKSLDGLHGDSREGGQWPQPKKEHVNDSTGADADCAEDNAISFEAGKVTGRADALREAADAVRALDIGRRNIERYLDHEFGISTNDAEIAGLLDGWRDAIEAEARADALREAAERVRALTSDSDVPEWTGTEYWIDGDCYVDRDAVLAILDPQL
jgi:hypothetical protein